jgi:hypothetical protein
MSHQRSHLTHSSYAAAATFMDYFSRYAIARPIVSPDARQQLKPSSMNFEVICKHCRPDSLLSDLGSNFMSKPMQEVLLMMNTRSLTTAYHPRTNGLVERFNGTLMDMLATLCNVVEDDWGEMVQPAVFAYNTTTQATLEENPFFVIHGRDAVLPGEPFTSYKGVHYGSTTMVEDDWADVVQPAIFAYNVSTQATLEENPFFVVHGRDAALPGGPIIKYMESHYGSTSQYVNVMQHRISRT